MIGRENVAKAIGAKMSLSFRGYDVAIFPLKNKKCFAKVWNKLDKVHSISNDLLDVAKKFGYNSKIPTKIIYPSIDVGRFKSSNYSKKIDINNIKFLTVARLHWKKD